MKRISKGSGFTIVEIVVASAIIVTVVIGVSAAWQAYVRLSSAGANAAEAVLLSEEANEALQYLRDSGWAANIAPLALNTAYYLQWNSGNYQLTTTPVNNQNLTRKIVFSAVARDAGTHAISGSGTPDPSTLSALITIYPTGNETAVLMQSQTLIHNVYNE